MNINEVVLSYLKILAWPILITFLAALFRSAVSETLRNRLTYISAGNFFSAEFKEVTQQAVEATGTAEEGSPETAAAPDLSKASRVDIRQYSDLQEVAQKYRDGVPVILELGHASDRLAIRMVDFSAGLAISNHGELGRLDDKIFLLTPPRAVAAALNATTAPTAATMGG